MPRHIPETMRDWWCDMGSEYAFVGISYEVTNCELTEPPTTVGGALDADRVQARAANSLTGSLRTSGSISKAATCGCMARAIAKTSSETHRFTLLIILSPTLRSDDIVDAAWSNGLGVHALIWFGWDDPNIWKTRRDTLFASLFSNPKAKYVTRVVQFGSEPLFDWALDPVSLLAEQVVLAKEKLRPLGIPVTVSEMAWGYQLHDNATDVMEAIDMIDAHMLPFFSKNATTGMFHLLLCGTGFAEVEGR